jgi:hypothetical protein
VSADEGGERFSVPVPPEPVEQFGIGRSRQPSPRGGPDNLGDPNP